jgi:hypothetical protein
MICMRGDVNLYEFMKYIRFAYMLAAFAAWRNRVEDQVRNSLCLFV